MEFSLVIKAPVCADIMHIWTRGRLQLTHGMKALEKSKSFTANSSESLLNHPPELLSQDI